MLTGDVDAVHVAIQAHRLCVYDELLWVQSKSLVVVVEHEDTAGYVARSG